MLDWFLRIPTTVVRSEVENPFGQRRERSFFYFLRYMLMYASVTSLLQFRFHITAVTRYCTSANSYIHSRGRVQITTEVLLYLSICTLITSFYSLARKTFFWSRVPHDISEKCKDDCLIFMFS